jgi:hypothetical protein
MSAALTADAVYRQPATLPQVFSDYYRSPASLPALQASAELSDERGFFRFGRQVCYGRRSGGRPSPQFAEAVPDVSNLVTHQPSGVTVPFDFSEVVTSLRLEQYLVNGYPLLERIASGSTARQLYYFLRPMLRVGLRRHLQRIRLNGWERIPFPKWPVDSTVDALMQGGMSLLLDRRGAEPIPFIWFWPDGARACAMVTHDVEGDKGRRFCDALMDLNDAFGIKAAFQLIPQGHESAWRSVSSRLRARGFEVNLHDLNHDGYLFDSRALFLERAKQINRYAREFECEGFRSGAMYREQGWYDAFEFSYDMSVPNVAHLEPQRGGCCTVMPYFVGNILELPLTTIQDYSLFHILGDYSIDLWRQQAELILEQNGLMTFLTHPDYLTEAAALPVYKELLEYIADLRAHSQVWTALPGEVNRWWRSRQQMTLVPDSGSWRIEGPDAHRARVAYATSERGAVRYTLACSR